MSTIPQSLRDVKRYLVQQTGKDGANFGIRGYVGSRRVWGYHLGRSDIYGPGGYGDRDYSNKRPRDRKGLSQASSAIDIRLSVSKLKALVVYLRAEAQAGRADIMEVLGPDANGEAKRYAKPYWNKPLSADGSHRWHVHISYPRDTEFRDRTSMLYGFFGVPDTQEPDEPEVPLPDDPELPAPVPPAEPAEPMPDDTPSAAEEALGEIAAIVQAYEEAQA